MPCNRIRTARRLATWLAVTLALAFSVAGTAAADNTGALGPLVVVSRNSASADTYLQFHGRAVVGDSIGGYVEYRWGGASCGSRTLTEFQVGELIAGMNNPRLLVEPLWQAGQGNAQCLVGYSFVLRSETGALP